MHFLVLWSLVFVQNNRRQTRDPYLVLAVLQQMRVQMLNLLLNLVFLCPLNKCLFSKRKHKSNRWKWEWKCCFSCFNFLLGVSCSSGKRKHTISFELRKRTCKRKRSEIWQKGWQCENKGTNERPILGANKPHQKRRKCATSGEVNLNLTNNNTKNKKRIWVINQVKSLIFRDFFVKIRKTIK